ncbi:MAG: hypothetical protein EXR27_11500 [Betaproteobacteria bacterium]|nr:hypothetical protein [Betaproteobacteria bacterium]
MRNALQSLGYAEGRDVINEPRWTRVQTQRIPAMYERGFNVHVGGLMSYGADGGEINRIVADYAVRIIKGAKPADLPVQQPNRYYLTINMKTAKALGIAIPQTVLLRADEVIGRSAAVFRRRVVRRLPGTPGTVAPTCLLTRCAAGRSSGVATTSGSLIAFPNCTIANSAFLRLRPGYAIAFADCAQSARFTLQDLDAGLSCIAFGMGCAPTRHSRHTACVLEKVRGPISHKRVEGRQITCQGGIEHPKKRSASAGRARPSHGFAQFWPVFERGCEATRERFSEQSDPQPLVVARRQQHSIASGMRIGGRLSVRIQRPTRRDGFIALGGKQDVSARGDTARHVENYRIAIRYRRCKGDRVVPDQRSFAAGEREQWRRALYRQCEQTPLGREQRV